MNFLNVWVENNLARRLISNPTPWLLDPALHIYSYHYYKKKRGGGVGRSVGLRLSEDSAAVVLTGVGSPSFTTLLLFKEVTDVFRGHHLGAETIS